MLIWVAYRIMLRIQLIVSQNIVLCLGLILLISIRLEWFLHTLSLDRTDILSLHGLRELVDCALRML